MHRESSLLVSREVLDEFSSSGPFESIIILLSLNSQILGLFLPSWHQELNSHNL